MFSKRDLCCCCRCQKEYQPKEHSSDSFPAVCPSRKIEKWGGKEPSEVSSFLLVVVCCSSIVSADTLTRERERRDPFFRVRSFFFSFRVRNRTKSLGFKSYLLLKFDSLSAYFLQQLFRNIQKKFSRMYSRFNTRERQSHPFVGGGGGEEEVVFESSTRR